MFNPYHEWLGLPPGQQSFAPSELLGVASGETNRAVLEAAALRRLEQVRPYQVGYLTLSSRLLNEISGALTAMLNAAGPARQATAVATNTVVEVPPCAIRPVAPRPAPGRGNTVLEGVPVRRPTRLEAAADASEATVKKDSTRRVKLLVLCQGDLDGTGEDVNVWQVRLEEVKLTPRQRQKLRTRFAGKRAASGATKARVLARVGNDLSGGAVVALAQKGLAQVKRVRRT